MSDIFTAQRDIELLKEPFKQKLKNFLIEMKQLGDEMKPHETLRTAERQAYLLNTGKSKVKRSNHQDGIAADLHFVKAPNFPNGGDTRWLLAAKIAKKHGIDCGGILWNWDWNHFQDDGSPIRQALGDWKDAAREFAMSNGISNGERPLDELTRVELWETLRKYTEFLDKRY